MIFVKNLIIQNIPTQNLDNSYQNLIKLMNLRHKIFQDFNSDLKDSWEKLEKKSNSNPFNSYYFHENIFKVNIIYKKRNYVPMIFCIYDEDDIVAILPLERLF